MSVYIIIVYIYYVYIYKTVTSLDMATKARRATFVKRFKQVTLNLTLRLTICYIRLWHTIYD